MLPMVGFEPGTSRLLGKIVTERSRVRISMRTIIFYVRKMTNFAYCVL